MKQILSPRELDAKRDLPVMAWTVTATLWYGEQTKLNRKMVQIRQVTLQKRVGDSGKTFVLYKMQMLRLLSFPKPLNAQIAIELPCLMGFRTAEVASWRAEWLDFQNMNCKVLDSKKHIKFTLPMSRQVAKHSEELLNGRLTGPVIMSTSNRNRGDEIVPMAVWHIWRKWTVKAGLPNALEISPLTGRRFFAGYRYHWLKQSLITISKMMRHAEPGITLHYVSKIVFWEDVVTDFNEFERRIAEDMRGQWLTVKERHP